MAISDTPVEQFASFVVKGYETSLDWHNKIEDDSVPYAILLTGTEVFAAAFGCPVHIPEYNLPFALPIVETAEEADKIAMPDINAKPLARIFEVARAVRERLGPDVPISVPDIQSPFDIAALVWKKESFFLAMHDNPDAVKRLVDKCHQLLKTFLLEYKAQLGEVNFCHCPVCAWAPSDMGCWLSEDEAGSLSTDMFEEFCLPSLTDLSETFGGLFMHCCATADHQYSNFNKIPNLRGLNRNFQEPGPVPAIKAFAGKTVLMQGWSEEQMLIDNALPESRYLFVHYNVPLDDAKREIERFRKRCPRQGE
jgi:uroporphyrinogen-III decarboxylase